MKLAFANRPAGASEMQCPNSPPRLQAQSPRRLQESSGGRALFPGCSRAIRVKALLGLVAALACPAVAAAATEHSGPSSALFLAQLIALLLVGRLMGEFMLRIGQPVVMGQLLAGILLGPSVLGSLWPTAQHALFPPDIDQRSMIEAVAQLGVLMLLLLTGMETDLASVGKLKRPAITASVFGIAVPFAAGFALGEALPDSLLTSPDARLITALFCGIALSISSVKIVAMVVREIGFTHRRVGQVLLAAAIVDDTVGWIILAAILGLAQHGRVDGQVVIRTLVGTVLFLALSFTIGRRAVSLLIRATNDHLRSEMAVITMILTVMGAFALVTDAIGVHTVLGAFVAGMLVGHSPILTRHIDEQLRGLIVALFMPVFFGLAGLTADLSILVQPTLLGWAAAFIVVASVGKFGGSFVGGLLGKLSFRESLALGCGMNARGSTEVILASLGLSLGALNTTMFTLIVTMAVVTTLAMPPMLRWALARVPATAEEDKRLGQMAFEDRGYVPNLERLLAAIDRSPSGALAARFVGLLAGAWGMPTTVVPLKRDGVAGVAELDHEATAIGAALAAAVLPGVEADRVSGSIETTAAPSARGAQAAIARVSQNGFDLLWVGTEPSADVSGVIDPNVADVAAGFDGNTALVFARGDLAANPLAAQLRILLPVNGTAHSRRAAEVALALAHACRASVTALYVAQEPPKQPWRRTISLAVASRRAEEAILRETTGLAQQYGVQLRPVARTGREPGEAILDELARGDYNLMALGVTKRPGETLALGATARVVLARSSQSVLLHAS